jgi:hypothetical protein
VFESSLLQAFTGLLPFSSYAADATYSHDDELEGRTQPQHSLVLHKAMYDGVHLTKAMHFGRNR